MEHLQTQISVHSPYLMKFTVQTKCHCLFSVFAFGLVTVNFKFVEFLIPSSFVMFKFSGTMHLKSKLIF